ncbi:MAG: hypothetical protein A2020_01275 [Lentisphaerae bacterium GWF2_45_14]|nr:MAG: hypothetical protein A2020_01275 [Lentisphaerae bacterium GWF2_45_14]
MKKAFLFLIFSALSLVFSSCAAKPEEPKGLRFETGRPQKELLRKLKDYSLSLEAVSIKRSFKRGEDAVVTFRLTNIGKRELVVYEWMMDEESNIVIYYIPFSPALKRFDKGLWNSETPSLTEKPRRSVLTLNTGNSVYVDKKLKFVKELNPLSVPESGMKYLIVGELNLSTVAVRSPITEITITK